MIPPQPFPRLMGLQVKAMTSWAEFHLQVKAYILIIDEAKAQWRNKRELFWQRSSGLCHGISLRSSLTRIIHCYSYRRASDR